MRTSADQLPTVLKKVEKILQISPETRESDKILYVAYLVLYHDLAKKLGSKFHIVRDILLNSDTPSMDSVSRTRRILQSSGKFPPCDPKRRKQLEAKFIDVLESLDS